MSFDLAQATADSQRHWKDRLLEKAAMYAIKKSRHAYESFKQTQDSPSQDLKLAPSLPDPYQVAYSLSTRDNEAAAAFHSYLADQGIDTSITTNDDEILINFMLRDKDKNLEAINKFLSKFELEEDRDLTKEDIQAFITADTQERATLDEDIAAAEASLKAEASMQRETPTIKLDVELGAR